MKSFKPFILVGIGLSLFLTACGSNSASPTTAPTTASPTPTPPAIYTWSLTGEKAPRDVRANPIMVVKVENDPSVRPQYGLDMADMVFEELVEGGITRFATVWQSQLPKELGPVRSVRHVDAAIAAPMADLFVFSGGARPTIRFIKKTITSNTKIYSEGAPGMHRTRYHSMPHNLFLYPDKLIVKGNKTSSSDGFFVNPAQLAQNGATAWTDITMPATALKTPSVALTFSNFEYSNWTWDAPTGTWLRKDQGRVHTAADGTQIHAKNIVIIRVKTGDAGYNDPAGHFVPRTILTGTGTGYLLSNGLSIPIKWSKTTDRSQMALTDLMGAPVSIPIGNTWVELVPLDGGKAVVKVIKPVVSASPTPSKS